MFNYLYKGQDRDVSKIDVNQRQDFEGLWHELIMEFNHRAGNVFTDANTRIMSK